MPWHVAKSASCPDGKPWAVIKDDDSSVVACHESKGSAEDQLAALYASERGQRMGDDRMTLRDAWQKLKGMITMALDGQEKLERMAQAERFRAIGTARLWEQVSYALAEEEVWAWLIDIYIGDAGTYALVTREGKLYKIDLSLVGEEVGLGEWVQVTEIHQPVAQRMTVQRQADGQWRWLNISGAAVLNRVGEIDSMALFDNMIRHAEEGGEYPYRTFYHQGEAFKIGQADLLARDGALYITSGVFDDNPLAQAVVRALQAEPEYWGDSIGYLPLGAPDMVEVAAGVEVPVYTDGIHREISTLPEKNAASLFTVPSVQQQEVSRMNANVLAALERLRDKHGLDQEVIDEFVDLADQTNRGIEDEGLITREGDQETEPETPVEELDQEPESETDAEPQEREAGEPGPDDGDGDLEVELDEEAVDAIVDRVAESPQFVEITQRLDELQALVTELVAGQEAAEKARVAREKEIDGRLADLEREDEEKQRQWLEDQPRRRTVRVTHRPRQANQPGKGGNGPAATLADNAQDTLDAMPRY